MWRWVGELTVSSNVEIGTANLFVDTTTGNVGVGTASPDSIFHTYSGAGADEVWVDKWKHSFDANWNFRLSQRHDHGINVEYGFKQRYNTTEYSPITFRGSTMELSGNVGIGTASPTYKLNISTDTNYDGISLRDSTRELLKIAKGNNGSYINMFDSGTSKVNISTTGNSYINGGNVGIGTNNPIGKLDVITSGSPTSGGNTSAWDTTIVKFGPNSGTTGAALSFGAGLSTIYKTYAVSLAPAVAWCSHSNLALEWYWIYGSNQRCI